MQRAALLVCVLLSGLGLSDAKAKGCWNALKAHNDLRKLHGAPALKWDKQLEAKAKALAESYAPNCLTHFAPGGLIGLHIWSYKGKADSSVCPLAVKAWYSTGKSYKWSKKPWTDNKNEGYFFAQAQDFVMIVWKSYTRVGCAYARGGENTKGCKSCTLAVCAYSDEIEAWALNDRIVKANVKPLSKRQ